MISKKFPDRRHDCQPVSERGKCLSPISTISPLPGFIPAGVISLGCIAQMYRTSPFFPKMWAQLGLNQRPPDYESGATNQLSYGPGSLSCNRSKIRLRIAKIANNLFSEKFYQTLISTSTPLGNSSFIKASTVLGIEL